MAIDNSTKFGVVKTTKDKISSSNMSEGKLYVTLDNSLGGGIYLKNDSSVYNVGIGNVYTKSEVDTKLGGYLPTNAIANRAYNLTRVSFLSDLNVGYIDDIEGLRIYKFNKSASNKPESTTLDNANLLLNFYYGNFSSGDPAYRGFQVALSSWDAPYFRFLRNSYSDWLQLATTKHVSENYLPLSGTAANSSKLGGQLPSYYATKTDVEEVVTYWEYL